MGAAIARIFRQLADADTWWGVAIARIFRPWLGDALEGDDDTLCGDAGNDTFVIRLGEACYSGEGRITLEGVQASSLDANDVEFTGIAQEGVDVVVIMIAVGCVVACLTLIGWVLFWRRR